MAKAKKYQDFIFPEGVTTLNADKFVALGELINANDSYIRNIVIPASVTKIEKDAFTLIKDLKGSIAIHPDNEKFFSIGKTILSKDGKKMVSGIIGEDGLFVIPDGVEELQPKCLSWFGNLNYDVEGSAPETIILVFSPSVIKTPKELFFSKSYFDPEIIVFGLKNGYAEKCAGEKGYSFYSFSSWETHPTTINECEKYISESIGPDEAGIRTVDRFGNLEYNILRTNKDVTIPEGVKRLRQNCIYSHINGDFEQPVIHNLYIPASVKKIDDAALIEIGSITGEIIVDKDNPVYQSENNMIFTKNKKKLVYAHLESGGCYDIPDGVVSIEDGAFSSPENEITDCTVYIPRSLKYVKKEWFGVPHGKVTTVSKKTNEIQELLYGRYYQPDFETIQFGTFENTPMEWYVLQKEEGKKLILSRYIYEKKELISGFEAEDLFDKPFVTWENCWLRQWLNTDYIHAFFTNEEQDKILMSGVKADTNPAFADVEQGNDTSDRIFLLSVQEAQNMFLNSDDRCALRYEAVNKAVEDYTGGFEKWWLRSSGESNHEQAVVTANGMIDCRGEYVYYGLDNSYASKGLRPAMWIKD